jgi:hypothetical protein
MAKKRKAKASRPVKAKSPARRKSPAKRKTRRAKKRKPMGAIEALVGTARESSALRRKLAGSETFED